MTDCPDHSTMLESAKALIHWYLLGHRGEWKSNGYAHTITVLAKDCKKWKMPKISQEASMRIDWIQVVNGKQEDGTYLVDGIGEVFVNPRDIEEAEELGGSPLVDLREASGNPSTMPQYVIMGFIPRSADAQLVAQRDNRRLIALRKIYDESGGDPQKPASWSKIIDEQKWSREDANDAFFFLIERGLMKIHTAGGPNVVLTRQGADEIENAIRHPNQPTHFFNAMTVQYITNNMDNSNRSINISDVTGSAIGLLQTGNDNTGYANQQINPRIEEIAALMESIRQAVSALPEDERIANSKLVDIIEAEVVKPSPVKSVVDAIYYALPSIIKAAPEMIGLYLKVFNESPPSII